MQLHCSKSSLWIFSHEVSRYTAVQTRYILSQTCYLKFSAFSTQLSEMSALTMHLKSIYFRFINTGIDYSSKYLWSPGNYLASDGGGGVGYKCETCIKLCAGETDKYALGEDNFLGCSHMHICRTGGRVWMEKLILPYNARYSGARGTRLTFVCTRTCRQKHSHTLSTCIHTLTNNTRSSGHAHWLISPRSSTRAIQYRGRATERTRERWKERSVYW